MDAGKVASQLNQATAAIQTLKMQQADLNKQFKEGKISAEEYGSEMVKNKAELEQQQRVVKSATAQLQAYNVKAVDLNGTLDEQRQALNTLQKAYGSLTKEQRDAEVGGQSLTERINELSERVKEQEGAIGDFRRNVGNYSGGVIEAFGKMGEAAGDLNAAKDVLNGFGSEGKKAAAALDMLAKVFKLTAQYGKTMSAAQQAQAVATKAQTTATAAQTGAQYGLNAAMDANPIGAIIAAVTTLITIIKSLVSAFSDATAETEKLNAAIKANNRLMEENTNLAEFEARVAAALGKSMAEQIDIRRKAAEENVRLANEEIDRLWKIRRTGTKKEQKAAGEALEAAQEAQKNAYEELNKLNQDATIQEIADRKRAADEAAKQEQQEQERRKKAYEQRIKDEQAAAAARMKNDAEITKMAEDFALSLIEDETAKRIAARKLQGEREIEELKNKLATEKNLTEQAREKLAQLIKDKQTALDAELEKMADDATKAKTDAEMQAEADKAMRILEYKRELAEEGSEEELAIQKMILDAELEQALNATKLEEEEKDLIIQTYAKKREELDKQYLENLKKTATSTRETYKAALMDTAKNASSAFGAMQSLLAEYGKENQKAAAASEAFGIAKIVTDQAISIADTAKAITAAVAGATEAASAGGPAAPFLLAGYIAAMVGAVLGAVASVAGSIQQAKQLIGGADGGKFAEGGFVPGTSYTGDRVNIRANSGEAVLTPSQQQHFMELANGGKAAFDYDAMAAVMVAAVAAQPAPVMDYSEFTDFQQRVSTYNEIAVI